MIATKSKVVSIHYRIKDNDDNLIDTNEDFAPLQYLHGYNNILTGLERALEGSEIGQEIEVSLFPSDAYGEYDLEKLREVNINEFSANVNELQPGVTIETSDGLEMIVTNINEQTVGLDGNHALAGKTLDFWVKVLSIREATKAELQHNYPLTEQNEDCGPDCCC